jgi:O-antigen ligase
MWRANPVLGVGLNLFPENVGDYDVRHVSLYRWPVHNIYLLWLSETGIVGTAGMVVFLIWAAFRIIRATAAEQPLTSLLAVGFAGGVLALYVGELASFGTRFDPVAAVFYILLGVMVAMGRTSDRPVTLGRLGQLRVV